MPWALIFYIGAMNLVFFDPPHTESLRPLSFTRPLAAFRVGIFSIAEKWQQHLTFSKSSFYTRPHLARKFQLLVADNNLVLNGSVLPNNELVSEIKNLKSGEGIYYGNTLVAALMDKDMLIRFCNAGKVELLKRESKSDPSFILSLSNIFSLNDQELRNDFELIKKNRSSQKLSNSNILIGKEEDLFIEEGAVIEGSVINAKTGPVYLAAHSEVMENSSIRGPFALCEHSVLKMSSKIYGATTIGPYSKIGGEVNNSVIFGFSNKAHDGFLGNSVIGEWCNLGADTNNSNLKNNYAEVKLWNYNSGRFEKTGLQFCGLIMADHAKCGINTMFNTGTVVGVGSNVFGSGFPRNFIPDFSWGGAHGLEEYQLQKVFEVAKLVFDRRGMNFDDKEKEILKFVFEETAKYRAITQT